MKPAAETATTNQSFQWDVGRGSGGRGDVAPKDGAWDWYEENFEVPSDYCRQEYINDAVLLSMAADVMRRNPTPSERTFLKSSVWDAAFAVVKSLDWIDWKQRSLGLMHLARDRSAVIDAFCRFQRGPRVH